MQSSIFDLDLYFTPIGQAYIVLVDYVIIMNLDQNVCLDLFLVQFSKCYNTLFFFFFLSKFSVEHFSGTIAPRILKFAMNVGHVSLYYMKKNWSAPAYTSIYLSLFLFLLSKFLSMISQLLHKPGSSKFIYTLRIHKYI